MNDKVNVELNFPTTIAWKNFGKPDKKIVDYVKKIALENKDDPFNCPCISTVRTYNQILRDKILDDILKNIIEVVGSYCQFTSLKSENLQIADSWANLYNEGGYQDLHMHHASLLSGVYYLKSQGNQDIVFQNPCYFNIPVLPDYNEININNAMNVNYETFEGRCMVFMSSLMHKTLPATDERISISFNITYRK